jgi:hypothetical protein
VTARIALAALLAAAAGCGGAPAPLPVVGTTRTPPSAGEDRPPIAAVVREGDARGAIAVAVSTAGIAPDRGALVAVALAALVEGRLAERGFAEVRAVGDWDGWRLESLAGTPAEAARVTAAAASAMLAPVAEGEPALAAVSSRVAALALRPLVDRAVLDVARCTGEAYGMGGDAPPSLAELETWRRAAHGLGRVAFATAGSGEIADATAAALARGAAWPAAAAPVEPPWPAADSRAVVYDASGEVPPAGARVVVTAWTAAPARAVASAESLGDARAPLASRLAALDPPAHLRSVVATAHPGGGCVAATIDLDARPPSSDAALRIATAAALARQELAVETADATAPGDLGTLLATRASDPREAAQRAAWWSLARARSGVPRDDVRIGLAIGVAPARDAQTSPLPGLGDEIRSALDQATVAWRAPVVEARTRVEQGQGEVWVLLASPCGTSPEANGDAGASAAAASAAAAHAARSAGDARVEAFVTSDGVGLLAHGPAHAGESAQAHAHRIADVAARAFAADALDPDTITRGRTSLLARASQNDARALAALGSALAPGHPSWVAPTGTAYGLGSSTDEALIQRLAAMRAGPVRVAVIANADQSQAEAAVRAADRWIVRRPGDARSCAPVASMGAERTGTYAVELSGGGPSEALVAVPVASDANARAAATWIAAALDGPGGLLERALGGGDHGAPRLATEWSATVLGAPRNPALVVRIVAPDTSLDAAVAQTRGLLDRLRQGSLKAEDRARAASSLARRDLAVSLDPRARVIQLWRGDSRTPAPSLGDLQGFASSTLRDEALVIVAARPQRSSPAFPRAHVTGKSRE